MIYYYGSKGIVDGDGRFEIRRGGERISNGCIVTVSVNLKEGLISWAVNGVEQFDYFSHKLTLRDIEWVPFLRMIDNTDKI